MKHFAVEIVEFNQQVLGIEQRELAPLNKPEYDLSVKCLNEEVGEFEDAHNNQDFIGQVDAMIDLIYFATGVLYKMGLDAEKILACQAAVHHANMTKVRGRKAGRGDGTAADAIKPEGWVAPEEVIAQILGG